MLEYKNFFETGSHCVPEADLKLHVSQVGLKLRRDLPASVSPSAWIKGHIGHHTSYEFYDIQEWRDT